MILAASSLGVLEMMRAFMQTLNGWHHEVLDTRDGCLGAVVQRYGRPSMCSIKCIGPRNMSLASSTSASCPSCQLCVCHSAFSSLSFFSLCLCLTLSLALGGTFTLASSHSL